MLEQDPEKGQIVKEIYRKAEQMKTEGVPAEFIEDAMKKELIEKGFKPQAAVMIVGNLPGVRKEPVQYSDHGKKTMIAGCVLFCLGVLVTWVSEVMAIKKGGGYYIIAIGPMLTGIGIFVKGFFDYRSQW